MLNLGEFPTQPKCCVISRLPISQTLPFALKPPQLHFCSPSNRAIRLGFCSFKWKSRTRFRLHASKNQAKSESESGNFLLDMEDFDGADDFEEDGDGDDDDDDEVFVPLRNMKEWLQNKPRGFGEGKVYDTSIEDELMEEIEQSRRAQLANINNLKNNPVNQGSMKKQPLQGEGILRNQLQMPSQFVLASQVTPIHTRRAMRLRLVRTYEVPELRGRATSKSKECLFHDEEGTYIHGTISREYIVKYRTVFVEGKVYSIKNFLVVTNYYTYKTSNHKYLLKFNYSTTVKELKSRNFPNFMFRLKSFQSLMESTSLNDKELFDIIGRVVEICSPVEKVIAGKQSRLMDFLLEDSEQRQLKCTIWDDHVEAMLPYFNSTDQEPVIVLIQLCRAKTVNGEVRITSSYDATKLWFNHYCPEYTEFKAKLSKESTPMRTISTTSIVSQSTDLRDFISGSVVITTIADLPANREWRFLCSCNDHWD